MPEPLKKILVVDDSSTALLMSMTILSRGGFVLIAAHDGVEAVEKAHAEHPDLIVMDVVMPKMDGFEACRELRRSEDTRNIPVLLVTTRGEPVNVEKGYESGCTDYLSKPIRGPELLAKVRGHLTT
jgi:CheY-like chemotaxis protein